MEISLISGLMERNNDETNSEWKYVRLALTAIYQNLGDFKRMWEDCGGCLTEKN